MQRIAVLGSPGSGKSTFALKLAKVTGLPLVHLDKEFHLPGWQERAAEEWADIHAELISRESWIVDGCYGNTAAARVQRADLLIWFDISTLVCLYRVLKRIVSGFGRERFDTAPGCPERFDFEFLRYVLRFRRDRTPALMQKLAARPAGTELVIIRNNADLERVLLMASSRTHPANA